MDRGSYEKLSIRDSARSLKKYGSTSKHVNRNENYIKHYVTNSDTLQGIALRYDVTIEQIRRINRLWASDSLFLKEYLLIPVADNCRSVQASNETTPVVSPTTTTQISSSTSSISNFDDDNINDFLGKIDASIASTKEDVRKTQSFSEFAPSLELGGDSRRKPAVSRMKQMVNNNGMTDFCSAPQAVVVPQGRKAKSSLQRHEKQQEELFEL